MPTENKNETPLTVAQKLLAAGQPPASKFQQSRRTHQPQNLIRHSQQPKTRKPPVFKPKATQAQ